MTDDPGRHNTRARFEQWAANPACHANTFSAVHNVQMAEVAVAEGYEPTMGQSPFALARGETFERSLFHNDAERLIEELIRKGVLSEGSSGFLDLRIGMNGGPIPTLDQAISETRALLVRIAESRTRSTVDSLPAVVAAATVRIPRGVMLPEALLIIDTMAIVPGTERHRLVIGEVKTYPDRGGYTDRGDLALARAQAGLYVHAMDVVVAELDLEDRIEVDRSGFLVLTRPGSNLPSVRTGEELRYQVERARRGFELLERAAQGLRPFDRAVEDPVESVIRMDVSYSEACLSFCDRAARCHSEAVGRHDPVILGDEAARFFGTTDLNRAVALMLGAVPEGAAEEDLVRRIREAEELLGYG